MKMRLPVMILIEAHALGAMLAGTAAQQLGYHLGGNYLIGWGWMCLGVVFGHIATKANWLRPAHDL